MAGDWGGAKGWSGELSEVSVKVWESEEVGVEE